MKKYNFQNPADVLAAYAECDPLMKMLLSAIYWNNSYVSQVGYEGKLLKQLNGSSLASGNQSHIQSVTNRYLQLKARRTNLTKMITLTSKYFGMTAITGMSGRIKAIVMRDRRSLAERPSGGFVNLSQKALFLFSDLYAKKLDRNIIDLHMLGDSDAKDESSHQKGEEVVPGTDNAGSDPGPSQGSGLQPA
jgi:hypothetical protein